MHPVTDDIAPGYSTVIKKPMDFSTMEQKAARGEYTTWQQVAVCIFCNNLF